MVISSLVEISSIIEVLSPVCDVTKVVDKGGDVGPALTDIGSKKKSDYLLEAIVAPNAKIAEGFETIIVFTDAGDQINGILKKETDEEYRTIECRRNDREGSEGIASKDARKAHLRCHPIS